MAGQRRTTLHSTMLLLYRTASAADGTASADFTFHYASTISRFRYMKGDVMNTLHSTMLLLYLV